MNNKPVYRLHVPGGLPTLNQHEKEARGNRYAAAKMKQKHTEAVTFSAWEYSPRQPALEGKYDFVFTWYELNNRQDHDNVAFAKKYILDGLQKAGILPGDGPRHVGNFIDKFEKALGGERGVYIEVYEHGHIRNLMNML